MPDESQNATKLRLVNCNLYHHYFRNVYPGYTHFFLPLVLIQDMCTVNSVGTVFVCVVKSVCMCGEDWVNIFSKFSGELGLHL